MGLIVQKFALAVVLLRMQNVFLMWQTLLLPTYQKGNDVIVVVSAQGDTTDDLIEKGK